jgi:hypothetical protein
MHDTTYDTTYYTTYDNTYDNIYDTSTMASLSAWHKRYTRSKILMLMLDTSANKCSPSYFKFYSSTGLNDGQWHLHN